MWPWSRSVRSNENLHFPSDTHGRLRPLSRNSKLTLLFTCICRSSYARRISARPLSLSADCDAALSEVLCRYFFNSAASLHGPYNHISEYERMHCGTWQQVGEASDGSAHAVGYTQSWKDHPHDLSPSARDSGMAFSIDSYTPPSVVA